MPNYTPDPSTNQRDAFVMPVISDPQDYSGAYDSKLVTAFWIGVSLFREMMAASIGAVSGYLYGSHLYVISGGLAVGDPVRISGNNTVIKALSTSLANGAVIGFCRWLDGAGNCRVDHFIYVTGLAGGAFGDPVYLQDAGGYGAAAGTVAIVVGQFLTATTALLNAKPRTQVQLNDATGVLTVPNGGTGAATETAHGVLLGQGTGAITAAAVGATGTVLRGSTGADPAFGALITTDLPSTQSPATLSSAANTPGAIGGNTDNYAPGAGAVQLWSASGAFNVTGMVAGLSGEVRLIWNAGATNTITLKNLTTSSAANQWECSTGTDLALAAKKCALAVYDATATKWRVTLLP